MSYFCCVIFPGYLSCYLVQPAPGIEYKAEDESPIDCYVKVCIALHFFYSERQDNVMNNKTILLSC